MNTPASPQPAPPAWAVEAAKKIGKKCCDMSVEGANVTLSYNYYLAAAIIAKHAPTGAALGKQTMTTDHEELFKRIGKITSRAALHSYVGVDEADLRELSSLAQDSFTQSEQSAELTALKARLAEVSGALEHIVYLMENAGVMNLMRGVQLGSVSWMVKMNDAISWAKTSLATPPTAPAAGHSAGRGK